MPRLRRHLRIVDHDGAALLSVDVTGRTERQVERVERGLLRKVREGCVVVDVRERPEEVRSE